MYSVLNSVSCDVFVVCVSTCEIGFQSPAVRRASTLPYAFAKVRNPGSTKGEKNPRDDSFHPIRRHHTSLAPDTRLSSSLFFSSFIRTKRTPVSVTLNLFRTFHSEKHDSRDRVSIIRTKTTNSRSPGLRDPFAKQPLRIRVLPSSRLTRPYRGCYYRIKSPSKSS